MSNTLKVTLLLKIPGLHFSEGKDFHSLLAYVSKQLKIEFNSQISVARNITYTIPIDMSKNSRYSMLLTAIKNDIEIMNEVQKELRTSTVTPHQFRQK